METKPAGQSESRATNELPTHSADGIDLTLIRWMLSLTPAERLQVLQRSVHSILRLRESRTEA